MQYLQHGGTYTKILLNFLKRFIAQTVYTRCTNINYKIVPVTNFYKYVLYGTSEMNNMYINIGVNNGSEK